jgi:protein-tyrosine phosphatase/arsenate reductase
LEAQLPQHVAHHLLIQNVVNPFKKLKMLFQNIKELCDHLVTKFGTLSEERKTLLSNISKYIQTKQEHDAPVNLVYVCTHNSRRSHFGQVWAAVAASYYNIPDVTTFSGGTETTAFNPNAINALISSGFEVTPETVGPNAHYTVRFGNNETTTCFSKVYDDEVNPKANFAAIMTCSDAEENCPFIPGVELRIGTTYDDPKAFDGTPQQEEKYLERSNQIALECLYVFSQVQYLQHDFPLRNVEN